MPIPIYIEQPSQALRPYIERHDLRDLLGSKYKRRKSSPEEKQQPVSRRHLLQHAVDLRIPQVPGVRPSADDGATSFHQKFEAVLRTAKDAGVGEDLASWFEGYVSNPEKLEGLETIIPLDHPQGASEAPLDQASFSPNSMLASNISLVAAERMRFWNLVHKFENGPKPSHLAVHADRGSLEFWVRLARNEAPSELREIAVHICLERMPYGPGKTRRRAYREPKRVTCDKERMADVIVYLEEQPGWNAKRPAVRITQSRAGRVQYRGVYELPKELDAHGRWRVLLKLSQLFDDLGLMYTVVIHAPDGHNDKRNYHMHAIWYDRRCERVGDRWDIELPRKELQQLGMKVANKHSYTRGSASIPYFKAGRTFAILLRQHYAESCNVELAKTSSSRRYDPRTYVEMGIYQEPMVHLKDAAALEAVGVATAPGAENARKYYDYRFRLAQMGAEERSARRATVLHETNEALSRLRADSRPEVLELRAALDDYRQLLTDLEERELAEEKFGIMHQMARSRASDVVARMEKRLATIESGKAPVFDQKNRDAISKRRDLAEDHLSELKQALEPWVGKLAEGIAETKSLANQLADLGESIRTARKRIEASFTVQPERAADKKAAAEADKKPTAEEVDDLVTPGPEQRWAELRLLLAERRPYIAQRETAGGTWYEIPELLCAEQVLVRITSLQPEVQAFLRSQCQDQLKEIETLKAAVIEHGRDAIEQDMRAEFETAKRLLKKYENDPDFRDWIASEERAGTLALEESRRTAAEHTAAILVVETAKAPELAPAEQIDQQQDPGSLSGNGRTRQGDVAVADEPKRTSDRLPINRPSVVEPQVDAVHVDAVELRAFLDELRKSDWLPLMGAKLPYLLTKQLQPELAKAYAVLAEHPTVVGFLRQEADARKREAKEIVNFVANCPRRLFSGSIKERIPDVFDLEFPTHLRRRCRYHVIYSEDVRRALFQQSARLDAAEKEQAAEKAAAAARSADIKREQEERTRRDKEENDQIVDRLYPWRLPKEVEGTYERLARALKARPPSMFVARRADGLAMAIKDRSLNDVLSEAVRSPVLLHWLERVADEIPKNDQDVSREWWVQFYSGEVISLPFRNDGLWRHSAQKKKRKKRGRTGRGQVRYPNVGRHGLSR